MHDGHHRLPPVDRRHPSLLEEGAGGSRHRLVSALDDAVLLRGVRGREVTLNPLVGAVCRDLSRRELAAVIRALHPQLAAAFLLGICLMASAAAALVLSKTAHM